MSNYRGRAIADGDDGTAIRATGDALSWADFVDSYLKPAFLASAALADAEYLRSALSTHAMAKASEEWIVDIKGTPEERNFEVSVIRADNEQRRRSYGWHDLNEKICIFSNGGPCNTRTPQEVGDRLIRLAQEVADEFNERDGHK